MSERFIHGIFSDVGTTNEKPNSRQGWHEFEAGYNLAVSRVRGAFEPIPQIPPADMILTPKTESITYALNAYAYISDAEPISSDWYRRGYATAVAVIEVLMHRDLGKRVYYVTTRPLKMDRRIKK